MAYAGNLEVPLDQVPDPQVDIQPEDKSAAKAVLAGGCFWCVEAVMKPLNGVIKVTSGYIGGSKETADYRTVCSGSTDHAEAVEVQFDPAVITYGQILKYFFAVAHDPTQENRQGNDVGTQYRSVILFADDAQKEVASEYIKQLDAANIFTAPIKTILQPLTEFFTAEEYHQNYAELNPSQPYITHVAMPKVEKLNKYFGDQLKK